MNNRYGINTSHLMGSLGDFFGGLMGGAEDPYKASQKALDQYYNRAQGYQNPFYQAGMGAIPQYQDWLNRMQNPSQFINNVMGQYQESPWAKFQQQQAMRAAQNMGSASGLTGSTPLLQFAQQNAQNISSQDMQNWLSNVLGINTQYGAGVGNLMTGGQNAANALTNMATTMGENTAQMEYAKEAAKRENQGNLWGGLIGLGASLFGL